MGIPDITLREIVHSTPVLNTVPNPRQGGHPRSRRNSGLIQTEGLIHEKWNVMFVISSLVAVLMDPLFLYIPLIKQDVKCIRLDDTLKIAAVVFRSITDLVYVVKIFFQIYELDKITFMAIWRQYILIDILAILPIPQVTILVYFTKMRGSKSLSASKFSNFLIVIQYVPRLLRIYLACKEIKTSPKGKLGLWIKGVLNFLVYIFVSHIIGGFWYFFSVQRMMDCWHYACKDEDGCRPSSFNCYDHRSIDNIKLLNGSCPISPANGTAFDFGIFLGALESGLVGSTNYSQKLSNCFWWGLRNLSSLGSNLQPSIDTWENMFAALTSIMGLLLFLYLIGNLQMYMQVESASKEQLRWKTDLENMMRTERKNRVERSKGPEVEQWLTKNCLPMRLLPEIMEEVVQADVEQNRDVDVENILSILPFHLQSYIRTYKEKLEKEGKKIELWLSENRLPMRLKSEIIEAVVQRPQFEQNGVEDVTTILTMLPPQLRSHIESYMQKLREKEEEIDKWLMKKDLPGESLKSEIMETVLVNLEKGKVVDVENILSILPVPLQESIRKRMRIVEIERKIEEKGGEIDLWMRDNGIRGSFKSDIEEAVRDEFDKDIDIDVENFTSIYPTTAAIQDLLPFNRLKKIRLLEALDEGVLKAACERLRFVRYDSGEFIIKEGEPLKLILFVQGSITFEKRGSLFHNSYGDYIWGQELLVWPSSTSFPAELLATDTLSSHEEVTALVLTADDMESIGSTFRPQFDELTSHWLTRLKEVSKFQCMDEEVLKAIFLHLKQDECSLSAYEENEPIPSMNFIIEGSIVFTKNNGDSEALIRHEGEVYGDELLDWVLDSSFPTLTPLATHTARSNHDYTAQLSITAEELKSVGSRFRPYFSTIQKEPHLPPDLLTFVGLSVLQKVPRLGGMNEEVLKAISQHLTYHEYNQKEVIIGGGKPVDRMLFLLSGGLFIQIENGGLLADKQFLGEELIDWRAGSTSDATPPLPVYHVKATSSGKARLLVLMANDLENVMANFKSHFGI